MNHRYLPLTEEDRRRMLAFLGLASQEDLLAPVPSSLRIKGPLPLPAAMSEPELATWFRTRAEMNANLLHHPSFLGAGTPPDIPSWGNMMAEGRTYVLVGWWLLVFPGLFLSLVVLAVNLLGDGLRETLDPRLRRSARNL